MGGLTPCRQLSIPVMHLVAVFAAVLSPLQADLTVIRLKRTGISRGKLSAAFPEHAQPNCALSWLDGHANVALYNGKMLILGGPSSTQLSVHSEPAFIQSLEQMGLSLNDACSYVDRLNRGQILVSISTKDASEAELAWRIMDELKTEGIAQEVSALPPRNAVFTHSPSLAPRPSHTSDQGSAVWALAG